MRNSIPMIGLGQFIFGAIVEGILHIFGLLGLEWSHNSRIRIAIFAGVMMAPLGALFTWAGVGMLLESLPAREFGKALISVAITVAGSLLIASPFLTYFYLRRNLQK